MQPDSPRLGRVLIAALAFFVFAGAGWYITYLRAENTRLATQQVTTQKPALARPLAPSDTSGGRSLSSEQRDAILNGLRSVVSMERPVWFTTAAGDPEATTFRMTLQTIFEEAGWTVRGNTTATFSIKPGLYLFSADEEPPEYVHTVVDAFEAAGLSVSAGRGYRSFYEERKRENPNWNGFDLKPDQSYVLVIGPKPRS
jgi:hypothetical protein